MRSAGGRGEAAPLGGRRRRSRLLRILGLVVPVGLVAAVVAIFAVSGHRNPTGSSLGLRAADDVSSNHASFLVAVTVTHDGQPYRQLTVSQPAAQRLDPGNLLTMQASVPLAGAGTYGLSAELVGRGKDPAFTLKGSPGGP